MARRGRHEACSSCGEGEGELKRGMLNKWSKRRMERFIGHKGFDQGREELSDLVLAAGGGSEGETGKKEREGGASQARGQKRKGLASRKDNRQSHRGKGKGQEQWLTSLHHHPHPLRTSTAAAAAAAAAAPLSPFAHTECRRTRRGTCQDTLPG